MISCAAMQDNHVNPINYIYDYLLNQNNNTNVAVFNDGEINTINSKEQFDTEADQFNINYSNGNLGLSLKINSLEEPIIQLSTSQIIIFL